MQALVVYNIYSGKSKIVKNIDYICQKLKSKYEIVETFASTGPNSIRDYVLQNAGNYDLVVAAGGDGSINEVVNGLMMIKNRPTLAYVPTGTCNDTGKTLGLKKSLRKTMKIILNENKTFLDVNQINGQYFIYGLAAGNLTDVSYAANYKVKKRFGKFAYYFETVKSFSKDRTIHIDIQTNGKTISGKFFLFLATNSRYLASFKLHRKKRIYLNEGKLYVTLIRKTNRFINAIDFALFMLLGERYKHNIEHFETSNMIITSKNAIPYNTDGESLPKLSRIEVTVLSEQIEMIVSKRVLKRHFN
ncbi:MAG: YegS/Rv2252/BmrU family lipid kinase [Anaeroplasmataceae bacterium]|nr:YegS/Rv2252/BmrU family lipid kinase [Anaeroplasmataceae bacterium]MDE6414929.1 YegS/Rv2252/BmrU family lipid kinase [Anaeroplasmataceae bacterium]